MIIIEIMPLSSITLCQKKLFFMIVVSWFCCIETIRLYVFDSPSALQNVLQDEVSLANRLRSIYSKKYKYWTFLTHHFNSSAKNHGTTIRYLQHRLQTRGCQNCNDPNGHHYDLDLDYNKRKNEFYFRTNMFSKDSNTQVFNGAVHGLLMLQQVYDIDVKRFANGKIVPEQGGHQEMTAILHNRKCKLKPFCTTFLPWISHLLPPTVMLTVTVTVTDTAMLTEII